jgi:hypothetical protein
MQFFWLGGSRYVYAISWRRNCHRALREVEHLLRRDNDDEQDWEDAEQDVEMGSPLSEVSLPDIYAQEQGTSKEQDEDSDTLNRSTQSISFFDFCRARR